MWSPPGGTLAHTYRLNMFKAPPPTVLHVSLMSPDSDGAPLRSLCPVPCLKGPHGTWTPAKLSPPPSAPGLDPALSHTQLYLQQVWDKSAVPERDFMKSTLKTYRSTLKIHRSTLKTRRSTFKSHRSTLKTHRSTFKTHRSTLKRTHPP